MSRQTKEQVQFLLLRFLEAKATAKDEALLFQLLEQEKDDSEWEPLLEELIISEPELSNYSREEWQPVIDRVISRESAAGSGKLKQMFIWKKIAVAASIILVLGLAAFFVISKRGEEPRVIAKQNDVPAPQTNRAQIKLADGTIVYLDSAANGQLAIQNNVVVTKSADGKIVYDAVIPTKEGSAANYNTLFNPRGSKVQPLVLDDGTKVWLNAESSITYPTAFIGNERKVEITGEAYFEIAHDFNRGKLIPFIVSKGDMNVTVLGTHFNVNAYDDEQDINVTLLEGSVRVSASSAKNLAPSAVTIKPGEQAQLTANSQWLIAKPDLEQVMAWKSNKFYFESEDIKTIMRQLSRWYDVEVVYQYEITNHFTGVISRDVNVSKVFEMLQQTGAMHVEIEGKKIVIRK